MQITLNLHMSEKNPLVLKKTTSRVPIGGKPVKSQPIVHNYLVLWSCGPVVLWSCGPVVLWSCGPVVLWWFTHIVIAERGIPVVLPAFETSLSFDREICITFR